MLRLLLILFAVSFMHTANSQSIQDLYGEWRVILMENDGITISLKKPEPDTTPQFRFWGEIFQFNEDGSYSEHASAPCGLDDNHYHYSGNWKYDQSKGIIEFKNIIATNERPNIYHNYKVLSSGKIKILSFEEGILKIEVMKAWEQRTEKNKDSTR